MIPYGRQTVTDEDVAAVTAVLRGDWLTQGPAVVGFERAVAEACDVPYAVAFSSGTAALHAAAFAAGIGPGDELVTSAMTFAASANCGAYLGASPRFADIDPHTWNVSVDTVSAVLSERTRAVVPVHFTGLPAPVAELREHIGPDVAIVEDAAHALGASVDGVPVGACRDSDMAVFSFHPVKAVASGEGGMVTTRSERLNELLTRFRNHGFERDPARMRRTTEGGWYHEQHDLGFNYRLSDIHSALGRSQLARLGESIGRRNAIADRYRDALAGVDAIALPPAAPPGTVHAYHLFVIHCREGAAARRALYDALRGEGIMCQIHYIPVPWHPWYEDHAGTREGRWPAAERYYAGCLTIPCYPGLSADEQDRVIDAIRRHV